MSTEYGDAKSGSPSEAIASESTGLTLLSVVLTAGLTVALGVEANAWLRACLGVARRCTRQACGIRDAWDEFERRAVVVLGVSSDTQAVQARFKAKYELPFPVLADPDHVAGKAYGVTKPDSNSFERSTFVIAADGTIAKVIRRVKPDLHTDQVLAVLPI